ncbi:hypothetical protein [Microcoleus sp. A003_D6]|uniref:hypothetical protein n=1 Tax=Microcoleus sp. A003_D6 TaxID=3055266 RepID=UPI002FD0D91F
MKNWICDRTLVTTRIIAPLMGLIAIGSTSFAGAAPQQQISSINSANIDTASHKKILNNPEKKSIIVALSEEVQVSLENSVNSPKKIPLQQGMPYKDARQILIQQGWHPSLQGQPNLRDSSVKELFDLGYKEIKDCSGTGEGPCRFEFINQQGELLVIVATTRGSENTKRFVRNWWIEKKTDSNQQKSSSNIIQEGRYWLGGTDRGLEVKGKQYRYYDESNIERPWQPLSELQYIKKGVVFDGKNYWCLSTLAPKTGGSSCSRDGWQQKISHQLSCYPFKIVSCSTFKPLTRPVGCVS